MEIRRFGSGHRRSEGPPGTIGVEAQTLHADSSGVIAELALAAHAAVAPHSNPNLTYLIVIEGGGWVQVGGERARVSAGEAVVWPPDVPHAVWTELSPMRAIVVEFARDEPPPLLIAADLTAAPDAALEAADGGLANPDVDPTERHSDEGEPW
jgi:quercetin dioxygenase-like cupin family protein